MKEAFIPQGGDFMDYRFMDDMDPPSLIPDKSVPEVSSSFITSTSNVGTEIFSFTKRNAKTICKGLKVGIVAGAAGVLLDKIQNK